MKKLLLSTALALIAAPAYALDYDGYTWSGVNIHILSPNNISGGAGPITLWDKGKVVVPEAWCMDVDSYLTGSGHDGVLPFTLANADSGLPGLPTAPLLSDPQLKAISWLVDNGDKATTDFAKGAFQVAIWAEEYGPAFSYASTNGIGFDNLVSADAFAAGQSALGGFAPDIKLNFLVPIDPSVSQTLVFATGVPEMPTWLYGAMGFVLMGAAAGFRRKTARYAIS